MVVSSGGVTDGASIQSGATLVVLSGGIDGGDPALNEGDSIVMYANPTTVSGTEILLGASTSATLEGGASMVVSSGGVANFTTVDSGAVLSVSSGGEVGSDYFNSFLYGSAVVSSGGELVVGSGATELGSQVAGVEVVAGGTAIQDVIGAGGYELVQSGGTAKSALISGGTLEVASGGILNGVRFEGPNSALILDASASLQGLLVAGFGEGGAPDPIDLKDIAFGTTRRQLSFTEAAGGGSGTLTVTDGLHTASLVMAQYAAAFTASNFVLASDGHGGTMVEFTSATTVTGGGGHGHG
jgi:autotransporter passenger strand-loop-strand repeat protein